MDKDVFILLMLSMNIGGYYLAERIYHPSRNHFIYYLLSLPLISIGGLGLIIGLLKCKIDAPHKADRERRREIEEHNRKQNALKRKEEEEAQERERNFKNKQATVNSQFSQEKLIEYFSEIITYANELSSEKNNKNLLLAINDVINRIAKDPDINRDLYDNSFIKNDIELIITKFEECGLSNDIVVKRFKNLIHK